MELPKRKQNRLTDYDYSTAGKYFVTICTKNKVKILCDVVGGDAHIAPYVVLTQYGKTVEKYLRSEPRIEKYVIMPNHIHLIVYLDGTMWASSPTTVSNIVRSFKVLVTKEVGTSLFQRSYHDHVIRDERDYREIFDYIEDNPRKWAQDVYYKQ